jgi:hypothetical protein
VAHVIASSYFADRFLVVVTSPNCFSDLVRSEFRLAAQPDAPCFSAFPALAGAGADQLSLKLGKAAQHGQHQAAMRRRGVGPSVGKGAESGSAIGNDC